MTPRLDTVMFHQNIELQLFAAGMEIKAELQAQKFPFKSISH